MVLFSVVQQRSAFRTRQRFRLTRAWGAPLSVCVLLVFYAASMRAADLLPGGAALFQKHCLTCHRQPLTARTFEALLRDTRTPPLGMPAFDEEKLTDQEVLAIAEHLFPAAPKAGEGQPQKAAQRDSAADAAETDRSDQKHVPENTAKEPSEGPRRTLKERKAWLRGFGTH